MTFSACIGAALRSPVWVLELDPDYRLAVAGNPKRNRNLI
jgi:hypothetical protein